MPSRQVAIVMKPSDITYQSIFWVQKSIWLTWVSPGTSSATGRGQWTKDWFQRKPRANNLPYTKIRPGVSWGNGHILSRLCAKDQGHLMGASRLSCKRTLTFENCITSLYQGVDLHSSQLIQLLHLSKGLEKAIDSALSFMTSRTWETKRRPPSTKTSLFRAKVIGRSVCMEYPSTISSICEPRSSTMHLSVTKTTLWFC